MSEECKTSCSECKSNCASNPNTKKDMTESPHELSRIRKVVAVVSGKGGVGKSIVTSMMAILMQRREHKTAILDADITGPSIPRALGLKQRAQASEMGLFPVKTKMGIDVMSLNLLVENDTDPVVWRGPILGNSVKQFWTDVIWSDVDIMFIDMPPGTGDVPLTVYQSIPIEGIIVVTTPQELVSMIVEKAVKMADMMDIPVLGIVENMSYVKCPDCDSQIKLFGESNIEKIAAAHDIKNVAKIPVDPELAGLCDKGLLELFVGDWLDGMADMTERLLLP
ncbi:MAG: Mrp/NBP35 family ATP-binding protein [Eubacteriales bacterium]|nr:Mrp/NBP35 family ATP-binding protein [Eubacteriales bacterium]